MEVPERHVSLSACEGYPSMKRSHGEGPCCLPGGTREFQGALFAEDQEALPSTLAFLNTLLIKRGELRNLSCPLKDTSSTLILAAASNKLLMIGIAR